MSQNDLSNRYSIIFVDMESYWLLKRSLSVEARGA